MTTSSDQLLHHMGYSGTVETSLQDGCLHGRLLHITDIITYGAETVPQLVEEFKAAVEDYLAYCKEVGKSPDKPYTGSFNVRLGADRHRWLVEAANARGCKLNEVVCQAVDALRAQVDAGPTDVPKHHTIAAVSRLHRIVLQQASHAAVTSWNWDTGLVPPERGHHTYEHLSPEPEAVEIPAGSITESAGTSAKFFFTESSIEGHETAGAVLKRLN